MANGHGGRRPGAGRPPKRERNQQPVLEAEAKITGWLPDLVDRMFALAEAGDYRATAYLIDRILGKPRQAVEVSGEDGGPQRIVIEYADRRPDADPDAAPTPPGTAAGD